MTAGCRCQIVGWSRDPGEPHIPAQPEWEQADDCPVHPLNHSGGFRDWARAVLGPEAGDDLADRYTEALGRSLDTAVFYGTTPPIQENTMHADQIKEVSDTVDQAITQEDLDALGEAERLALVVGAAYGRALHERDEARAMVERLGDAIVDLDVAARDVLTLDALENPTWAQDERLADNLRAALEAARRAVDSIQTNQTQED